MESNYIIHQVGPAFSFNGLDGETYVAVFDTANQWWYVSLVYQYSRIPVVFEGRAV